MLIIAKHKYAYQWKMSIFSSYDVVSLLVTYKSNLNNLNNVIQTQIQNAVFPRNLVMARFYYFKGPFGAATI